MDGTEIQSKTPVAAFVTFRSMEGAGRADKLDNIKTSILRRMLNKFTKQKDANQFLGKDLKIKRAVVPELIRWENLGATKAEQTFWTIVMVIATYALLLVTITCIVRIRNLKGRGQ